jgi:sulfate permease, SulP family
LIALAFEFIAGQTFWNGAGLVHVKDKFGGIPADLALITGPGLPEIQTGKVIFDIVYFALAIYIVAAIESLLCSRINGCSID